MHKKALFQVVLLNCFYALFFQVTKALEYSRLDVEARNQLANRRDLEEPVFTHFLRRLRNLIRAKIILKQRTRAKILSVRILV